MAKVTGLKDYFVQLDSIVNSLSSDLVIEVAQESWSIIGDQIRTNAIALDLVLTGLLVDPKTILTHAGVTNRDGKKGLFAEAGVFKDDSAMSSYRHPSINRNRNPKTDIPSATAAYWLEFGVQPHYTYPRSNTRKTPVDERSGVKFHPGVTQRPFISKAYDEKIDEAYAKLSKGLGELIDRAVK